MTQKETAPTYATPSAGSQTPLAAPWTEAKTPESERLRDELELLGYIASHDLLDPLRRILPCCETLEKQTGTFIDNQGKAALQTITHEARRMNTLMQGMLEYLRLETYAPTLAMIDMKEAAAAAIADLQPAIAAAHVSITVDSLPVMRGHMGRLKRLFTCLIDNAVKFRGSQPLKVHISACRLGKDWEFSVKDNGMGIDEEYFDIVFRLFQRLNEGYPGEGIGLALSRKIVESHGGRIGVESSPGEGSRFYFTLPALA